jgi:hypothetical protein
LAALISGVFGSIVVGIADIIYAKFMSRFGVSKSKNEDVKSVNQKNEEDT